MKEREKKRWGGGSKEGGRGRAGQTEESGEGGGFPSHAGGLESAAGGAGTTAAPPA